MNIEIALSIDTEDRSHTVHMPVRLEDPIPDSHELYLVGEGITKACWPNARYLYTEVVP